MMSFGGDSHIHNTDFVCCALVGKTDSAIKTKPIGDPPALSTCFFDAIHLDKAMRVFLIACGQAKT